MIWNKYIGGFSLNWQYWNSHIHHISTAGIRRRERWDSRHSSSRYWLSLLDSQSTHFYVAPSLSRLIMQALQQGYSQQVTTCTRSNIEPRTIACLHCIAYSSVGMDMEIKTSLISHLKNLMVPCPTEIFQLQGFFFRIVLGVTWDGIVMIPLETHPVWKRRLRVEFLIRNRLSETRHKDVLFVCSVRRIQ